MFRTLHGRLMVSYLSLAIIAIGVLGVYLLQALNAAFVAQMKRSLIDEAGLIADRWAHLRQPLRAGPELDQETSRIASELGVTLVVTDASCRVLSHSSSRKAVGSAQLQPEVPEALRGKPAVCVRSGPTLIGREMHIAYPIRTPHGVVGVVRLSLPLSEIDAELRTVRRAILSAMVLLVLIAIPLSLAWARALSLPLRDMATMAAEVAESNFNRRVTVSGDDEIARLGTSLNSMADELERLFAQLEEAARREREFSTDVSHELRTPIATVRASAETLLAGAGEDAATRREFVEDILHETARMERVVEDLLNLARMESAAPLTLQRVRLEEVLYQVVDENNALAAERRVHVAVETPAGLCAAAEAQALRLILTNLVENALRYTDSGGRVVVRTEKVADGVKLSVQDTGCGIGAEHLPHVFDRFYRVDKHRSRDAGGTGLGLALVKRLVEAHGSSIHVESERGRGTTFWFVLPTAPPAPTG